MKLGTRKKLSLNLASVRTLDSGTRPVTSGRGQTERSKELLSLDTIISGLKEERKEVLESHVRVKRGLNMIRRRYNNALVQA